MPLFLPRFQAQGRHFLEQVATVIHASRVCIAQENKIDVLDLFFTLEEGTSFVCREVAPPVATCPSSTSKCCVN